LQHLDLKLLIKDLIFCKNQKKPQIESKCQQNFSTHVFYLGDFGKFIRQKVKGFCSTNTTKTEHKVKIVSYIPKNPQTSG